MFIIIMVMTETRRSFPDWLAGQLGSRGWSNVDLAARVGVVPSAVSQWLTGVQKPGRKSIFAIAAALEVDAGEVNRMVNAPRDSLIAEESAPYGVPRPTDSFSDVMRIVGDMVPVPVADIAAGHGAWTDETFFLPRQLVGNAKVVGYKVRGSSMEPDIPDGAYVTVDIDATAKPGDIVVAWTPEGGIIKRLRAGQGRMELVGNDGSTITVGDGIKIEGVVIATTHFRKRN
jgi:SOS-response transcriptional repressor LexA